MKWFWPLNTDIKLFPDDAGMFGRKRKYDYHTGIDLYCDLMTEVKAVEDGIVISIEDFTGPNANSPWWNPTQAILIEGESGVVVYGELEPLIKKSESVKGNQIIGLIKTPVLKQFKDRPTIMLHLELMKHGSSITTTWLDERPEGLLDPADYLIEAAGNELRFFDLNTYDKKRYKI
jgi:murein DD-endopeptidase MepM/ murein hydrolase activator NlpD